MAKANADYGKLLRYARVDMEHYATRSKITFDALTTLLADLPERARIWQLIERHALNYADFVNASDAVARYERLVERQAEGAASADGEAPGEQPATASEEPAATPGGKRAR